MEQQVSPGFADRDLAQLSPQDPNDGTAAGESSPVSPGMLDEMVQAVKNLQLNSPNLVTSEDRSKEEK